MKTLLTLCAATCSVALLGGCGRTLQVEPIAPAGPRVGIGYVLPFTQYSTTVTWTLDKCPDLPVGSAVPEAARIAVKVEATAGSADDEKLAFMIDPQELQSFTSVTSFTAKWHDGRNMLSTINASADDRSAQILGNVVKTAVKLFPLVAGMPVPLAPPGDPRAAGEPAVPAPEEVCTEPALKALKAAKAAKALLETYTAAVEAETGTVTRLTAKVAAMGGAIDEATKKELSYAMDRLTAARVAQSDSTDALAAALKPITYAVSLDWPGDGDTFSGGPLALPRAKLEEWINRSYRDKAAAAVKPVYLQIERTGTFGRTPTRIDLTSASAAGPRATAEAPYALPDPALKGLRYRMPAAGRLLACWRSPCSSSDPEAVLARFDGPIVQLGYVNVLPFRSRAFGNNSLAAEFAPDGSLKSVGYEQKAAPAEVLTGALADAAGQAASVLDPTARLKAQTDYLTALKAQRDALEGARAKLEDPVAAETSSLGADTALINARLANIQAQVALEELREKTGR